MPSLSETPSSVTFIAACTTRPASIAPSPSAVPTRSVGEPSSTQASSKIALPFRSRSPRSSRRSRPTRWIFVTRAACSMAFNSQSLTPAALIPSTMQATPSQKCFLRLCSCTARPPASPPVATPQRSNRTRHCRSKPPLRWRSARPSHLPCHLHPPTINRTPIHA